MVCAPERLVFEASPDLEAPLRQERREAIIHDGAPLDTLTECRELNGIEQADLDRRKAEAACALGKETDAAKKAFVEDRVERAVAKGMDRDRARLMAEQWGKRILCPGVSLCFDDPDLGEIDVADVLRDPGLFDGATLADPIEGIKYGRNCAIIHGVQIFSFAHGGARYRLQHDYPSVKEAIEAAAETEACAVFVRLAIDADLDPAQEKLLAKAAGDRSGVDAPEPPMRDAEGWPIEVQCREAVGLHVLTTNGANAEENAKSRLPSPKHFLLTRHERESLEIEWGDHLCFVQKTRDGERYVAPPDKFLNHYLKYRRSELPRAHAVLTMPLVLPDGSLLAGSGLDRERRAVLRIEPALLGFMPKLGDRGEVAEAFNFLMDAWLVDVATDAEGKCVLIALALSIIERVLLPERPVFFVTAGLRGGGKTTVLMMIALAAIGVKAAAAAWSSDPNERKKALFSYLLEGLPVLIWDNIPRGAAIGCPHIERASTCEFYSDRILGVTKTRTAPAYTIQAFTGNNIGPKSDQASRSLEARLTTDRPDPENRHFQHPDPIAWTLDHRGEILRALYTILLGNPQLDPDRRGEPETRFKTWWTLVGSAIEHAAGTAGKPLSFKSLFERVEAADEEASARADTLQTLYALFAGEKFTSANVLAKFGESAAEAFDGGQDEDVGIVELKRFCTPRHAKTFSAKSVGHALGSLADAPVRVAGGALSLRSKLDGHAKIKNYWLELKRGKTRLA